MSQIIQQRIEAALKSRASGDGPVSRDTLSNAGIPSGLRHFLLRSLDRRIHLLAGQLISRSQGWIDTHRILESEAVSLISGHLQEAGQFPPDEWVKAVPQAVEAQLAYLQEPARALAEFAFSSDSPTLPASDLRRRTGYFSDYPYMARSVDAWLLKRDEQRIDRDAFESAMRHLDCRLTEDYDAEQWIQLLQPLVDTMQFAGVQPAGLPVSMTIRFFEAKDRPAIAALIRSAAQLHRAEMITIPSLRDIILKAFENERLQEHERAAHQAERHTQEEQSEIAEPAPTHAPHPAGDDPLPLWKRFQQRADNPPLAGAPSNPDDADPREPGPQPLWKSFEDPGRRPHGNAATSDDPAKTSPPDSAMNEPVPVHEAPRLEAQHIVLGTAVRSRERFIRDLFEGNEDMFTDIMEHLAEAPDWTEASSIIADRVFRPYRIDIYSDVAVDFTNAVEARYSGLQS